MDVSIELFGAFTSHLASPVVLTVPETATVADLRVALASHAERLGATTAVDLLPASVFASSTAVLGEHERLPETGELALLPPVSGG